MAQRQSSNSRALLLVGDSDIARWPEELLPQVDDGVPLTVSGHYGATLQEIITHLEAALQTIDKTTETVVLVTCAGENDIGSGVSLDDTLAAFHNLVQGFFDEHGASRRLIFLGPKIEPWLEDDPASRKQYAKLSRAFQRACSKHERSSDIRFVDCLTMFCGESATLPGATLGGKAKAERLYFVNDQLHLSQEGYQVWKQVVEDHLRELFR